MGHVGPHHYASPKRILSTLDIDLCAFLCAAAAAPSSGLALLSPAPVATNTRPERLGHRLIEPLATISEAELYLDIVAVTFPTKPLHTESALLSFSSAQLREAAAASMMVEPSIRINV